MSTVVVAGYQARVTVARETTYGSIPSGTYEWVGLMFDAEPTINVNNIPIRKFAGIRDLAFIIAGRRETDFRFDYYMQSSGSGVQAGSTFLRNNNLFDENITGSFTTEILYDKASPEQDQVFYVTGCKIDTCTFEMRTGEPTRVTISSFGKDWVTGSAVSGSAYQADPGTAPFMWFDGQIQYQPDGGSKRILNNVLESRVTVRNNLNRIYNVQRNTKTPRFTRELHREIEGELTMNFESFDHLTELLGDTAFTLDLGFGPITLPAGTNPVTGSFYSCKWGSYNVPTRTTELVALRIPFIARSGSIT